MRRTYEMIKTISLGFALISLSGCGGCDDQALSPAPIVEGTQPGDCSDGADNDGDGLFDCDDSSCQGSSICDPIEEEGADEASEAEGDEDGLAEAPQQEDESEEGEVGEEEDLGQDGAESAEEEGSDEGAQDEVGDDDEPEEVVCEEGEHNGGNDICLPEGECADSFILVEGLCECPAPFALDPEVGDCSAIDPDPAFCNDSGTVTSEGLCECSDGFSGENCESCAVGFELENEACVAVPAETCEDYRANTAVGGDQRIPALGTTPEGGFIIAWFSTELERVAIKVQAFDAAGLPAGRELRADIAGAYPRSMAVIGLSDGRFSVAYEPRSDQTIVRTFAANGELLNQTEMRQGASQPSLYRHGAGFVILTHKFDGDGTYNAYRQAFNAQGTPNGGFSRLHNRRSRSNVFQLNGSGAELDSGAEVMAWKAVGDVFNEEDNNSYFFHSKCDLPARSIEHELVIARGINAEPKVAQVAPNGHFAVYWEQAGTVKALFGYCNDQGFDFDTGEPVELAQGTRPSISASGEGFVLGFEAQVEEADGADLFIQNFDGSGAATSNPTRLAQAKDGDQTNLQLMALPGGGIQAAWLSGHEGNEGVDVMTRSIETAFCPEVVPCFETTCESEQAYCDNVEGAASCSP